MPAAERRSFMGALSEVISTARWLDEIAIRHDLPADAVFALQICAEEVLTNIILHGGSSARSLEVGVTVGSERIDLTIDDDGEPFDVTKATPRMLAGDIETVQPGGVGVQLIHEFSSGLSYGDGPLGNRLSVTIDLHRPKVADALHA